MGQDRPQPGTRSITRRAILFSLGAIWLGGCRGAGVPHYTTIMDRSDNQVLVQRHVADVTLRITSASGIGHLHFSWWTPAPPALAAVELALNGLEHVAMTWHGQTISTAWPGDDDAWATRAIGTEPPTTLTHGDADWPTVTRSLNGHFVFVPPPSFNATAPLTWELAWVDFYR